MRNEGDYINTCDLSTGPKDMKNKLFVPATQSVSCREGVSIRNKRFRRFPAKAKYWLYSGGEQALKFCEEGDVLVVEGNKAMYKSIGEFRASVQLLIRELELNGWPDKRYLRLKGRYVDTEAAAQSPLTAPSDIPKRSVKINFRRFPRSQKYWLYTGSDQRIRFYHKDGELVVDGSRGMYNEIPRYHATVACMAWDVSNIGWPSPKWLRQNSKRIGNTVDAL